MAKIGKHIAIYGKGGIGKSTTTSNISAALAEAGYKVIQIGCDPKSDSTNTLRGNNYLPTVLDSLRGGNKINLSDISVSGFKNVLCIESGGPVPGVGCAGRGINAAVSLLQELHLFEEFKVHSPDSRWVMMDQCILARGKWHLYVRLTMIDY